MRATLLAGVGGCPSTSLTTPPLRLRLRRWICFAEKTQPDSLPYISTVKSPQQIMGTVVKRLLKLPGPVYHTSVMPCFDKKLEASRKEFEDVATGTRDVDCVLTSMEVRLLSHLLEREL